MFAQSVLELRQAEKVALFRDPLDLVPAHRTPAVLELGVRDVDFVNRAVPAFVVALVNEAPIAHMPPERLGRRVMPWFGRPDEIVVRNVQEPGKVAKLLGDAVGERLRRHTGLGGGSFDFLAVLVGAGQKEHIFTEQPVRSRRSVGHHGGVGVAQMRLRVDVVDGRADEETAHDGRSGESGRLPYAFMASACTSFTERLVAVASRAQSSNSGTALTTRPSRHAILTLTAPAGVSTVMSSRWRHSRSTSWCRRPMVVVSLKMMSTRTRAPFGSRHHGEERAGTVLLHLHGDVEHLERPGLVEASHRHAEQLRVHVVDLAFDDRHALGRRPDAISRRAADEDAQDVWSRREVPLAGSVSHRIERHRGNRSERRGVGRHDERAGRRHELFLHCAAVDWRLAQQLHRGRRRNGEQAVRRIHHAAADVERRRDNSIDAEPFQREDGADDVDNGVERADFVKVHLADGHLVDGGLRFAKTLKERLRPVAGCH